MTGIYFLIDKKKVVYIGQSVCLPHRSVVHYDKEYTSIRTIPCKRAKLSKYERRWIKKFQPKYNFHEGPVKNIKRRRKVNGKLRMSVTLYKDVIQVLKQRAKADQRSFPNYISYILCHSMENPPPTHLELHPKLKIA